MAYALQADLEERFGTAEIVRLTDRADPPTGVIDPVVVARALADAEAEVNGYIASRYTLPLEIVPEILKRMTCDVARYLLYDDVAPDQIRDRYKDAVSLLKGIADGKVSLGLVTAPAVQGETNTLAARTKDKTFSKDALDGF
jgi:phage gp36-like protein